MVDLDRTRDPGAGCGIPRDSRYTPRTIQSLGLEGIGCQHEPGSSIWTASAPDPLRYSCAARGWKT